MFRATRISWPNFSSDCCLALPTYRPDSHIPKVKVRRSKDVAKSILSFPNYCPPATPQPPVIILTFLLDGFWIWISFPPGALLCLPLRLWIPDGGSVQLLSRSEPMPVCHEVTSVTAYLPANLFTGPRFHPVGPPTAPGARQHLGSSM